MRKRGYETEKEEEPTQGDLMVRLLPGEQLGLNAIGGGASEDQCGAHLTWSYWMMRRQGTYSPAPIPCSRFSLNPSAPLHICVRLWYLSGLLYCQTECSDVEVRCKYSRRKVVGQPGTLSLSGSFQG